MALISCPECKAQISAKAPTCPNCGAPIALAKKNGQGWAIIAGTSIGLSALIIFAALIGSDESKNDQPLEQTKPIIDQRTGQPMINFTKQVWLRKHSLVCESEAELNARHAGAPAKCSPMPMAMPVAIVDRDGIIDPAYKVRVVGMRDEVIELWAGLESLMNDPQNEDLMPDASTHPMTKPAGKGGQKTKR